MSPDCFSGASYRALVDFYQLVNVLCADDFRKRERLHLGIVELVFQNRHQGLINQRGLSASAHSAYAYQHAKREFYVNILEIISRCPAYAQGETVAFPALSGDFKAFLPVR